jgi:hypothetical protein
MREIILRSDLLYTNGFQIYFASALLIQAIRFVTMSTTSTTEQQECVSDNTTLM